MPVRNYIYDSKTCKEFKGKWNPKQKKCNINHIKKIINDARTVDNALNSLNKEIKGYGIEPVRGRDWVSHYYQDINLLYVNKGDTYEPTVVYDTLKDIWYVGTSWGDMIESDMKRFEI